MINFGSFNNNFGAFNNFSGRVLLGTVFLDIVFLGEGFFTVFGTGKEIFNNFLQSALKEFPCAEIKIFLLEESIGFIFFS